MDRVKSSSVEYRIETLALPLKETMGYNLFDWMVKKWLQLLHD